MKIAAIGMFKDEADVAYHSVINLAEEGMDFIIVADNMSTDNTLEELNKAKDVLKGSGCEVVIYNDYEVGYYQSEKMTKLAHVAHDFYGADWLVPFDCDEIHYTREGKISEFIKELPAHINVVYADLYNHFPTAIDPEGINPFETIQWRLKEKGALPKIACKWHKDMVISQGNHDVYLPEKHSVGGIEIRHFPYRTWEQFKRKAINGSAAYKATNLKGFGDHWLSYAALIEKWGDDVVEQNVFRTYFYFFSPIDHGLINDPAPFRRWNKQ